ncbi:MAG: TIGR04283 family arsenosugar biosynthesis glycosyltransferase [Saprospiraceae bacterium]
MRISVIIPTLNEAENIGRLMRFLKEHGGDDLAEIIVSDGGSTDETRIIAQQLGAKTLRSSVRSRAAQMNLGAQHATGELLYFVHADTQPPPSFASDILYAIQNGIDMGCYKYQFDSPRFWLKVNAWFSRYNFIWSQGGDKTFFISADIFNALGGYDEKYVVMEEYDFIRRARKHYRMRTLQKSATVSARKYQHNSWLRVQLANMYVFTLFRWGVAPEKLKRIYKHLVH